MEEFTPSDAGAVATAADDARAEAERRRRRMPTSAAVFDQRAEQLRTLLNKILDRFPARFHEHRALVYRDYRDIGGGADNADEQVDSGHNIDAEE